MGLFHDHSCDHGHGHSHSHAHAPDEAPAKGNRGPRASVLPGRRGLIRALAITSAHPVTKLQLAIVTDDVDVYTSVSGVGRKTAQRIILELKEKVHAAGIAVGPGATTDSDVVAALESLGYSATEARKAAGAVAGTDGGLDARIKAALQELARSR